MVEIDYRVIATNSTQSGFPFHVIPGEDQMD